MTIRPDAPNGENPFADFAGALDTFPGGVPEITAWVRELRDDDMVAAQPVLERLPYL